MKILFPIIIFFLLLSSQIIAETVTSNDLTIGQIYGVSKVAIPGTSSSRTVFLIFASPKNDVCQSYWIGSDESYYKSFMSLIMLAKGSQLKMNIIADSLDYYRRSDDGSCKIIDLAIN